MTLLCRWNTTGGHKYLEHKPACLLSGEYLVSELKAFDRRSLHCQHFCLVSNNLHKSHEVYPWSQCHGLKARIAPVSGWTIEVLLKRKDNITWGTNNTSWRTDAGMHLTWTMFLTTSPRTSLPGGRVTLMWGGVSNTFNIILITEIILYRLFNITNMNKTIVMIEGLFLWRPSECKQTAGSQRSKLTRSPPRWNSNSSNHHWLILKLGPHWRRAFQTRVSIVRCPFLYFPPCPCNNVRFWNVYTQSNQKALGQVKFSRSRRVKIKTNLPRQSFQLRAQTLHC